MKWVHGHHTRGVPKSDEHRRKIGEAQRGRPKPPLTEAHRKNLSEAMKGRPVSDETREKIAAKQRGENSPTWKGIEAGYVTKHRWMLRNVPKTGVCELCGKRPPTPARFSHGTHWANRTHRYHRDLDRVRDEWIELCPKCHKGYDAARRNGTTSDFLASFEVEKPEVPAVAK